MLLWMGLTTGLAEFINIFKFMFWVLTPNIFTIDWHCALKATAPKCIKGGVPYPILHPALLCVVELCR